MAKQRLFWGQHWKLLEAYLQLCEETVTPTASGRVLVAGGYGPDVPQNRMGFTIPTTGAERPEPAGPRPKADPAPPEDEAPDKTEEPEMPKEEKSEEDKKVVAMQQWFFSKDELKLAPAEMKKLNMSDELVCPLPRPKVKKGEPQPAPVYLQMFRNGEVGTEKSDGSAVTANDQIYARRQLVLYKPSEKEGEVNMGVRYTLDHKRTVGVDKDGYYVKDMPNKSKKGGKYTAYDPFRHKMDDYGAYSPYGVDGSGKKDKGMRGRSEHGTRVDWKKLRGR